MMPSAATAMMNVDIDNPGNFKLQIRLEETKGKRFHQ